MAYEEDLLDILDITLDCWDCLLSVLCSAILWTLVLVTVFLKYYVLRPWLENYYRKTYATRQQIKKRRLRDALNDPVLVIGLEHRFLQSFGGNKQSMLRAMEDLRSYAAETDDDATDDDHDTKGEEKIQAAKCMMTLICVASMLPFVLLNFIEVLPLNSWRRNTFYDQLSSGFVEVTDLLFGGGDECGAFGDYVRFFLFSFAHLLDSYLVLRSATKGRNRRPSRISEKQSETMENNTLEQPLLSSSNNDEEEEGLG